MVHAQVSGERPEVGARECKAGASKDEAETCEDEARASEAVVGCSEDEVAASEHEVDASAVGLARFELVVRFVRLTDSITLAIREGAITLLTARRPGCDAAAAAGASSSPRIPFKIGDVRKRRRPR